MTERVTKACPTCQKLKARIAELEAELAKARKDSTTSSKPPSSDIVKPPPGGQSSSQRRQNGKKRRQGGQPGHPRHVRPAFPPEQIDQTREYRLDECPDCGGALEDDADSAARVIQQVEIVARPVHVTEHRGLAQWCAKCQKVHQAPLPRKVCQAGLVGPRLTALVAYLKGACHASYSTVAKFLQDVVGITLSRGQLAKLVQKVSAGLEVSYEELLARLPGENRLNVDETGHPEQKQRLWTWAFRAELFTLYRIDPSRGSDVLIEVLGREFNGVLGCDYFSAYRKYMKDFHVALQFCLAHLIRDMKFLAKHPHRGNRRYGALLLGHMRKLFGAIHRREQFASEGSFLRELAKIRNALVGDAIAELPRTREAGNLADRFVNDYDGYFQFITTPGVAPTNNLAEQAIRFVAIHRRITHGTRGERGRRWCERIWTAIATCGQQGRSVFQFVYQTVQAHFQGRRAPSLVPNTS
jgi:transposase